jgi:hypothetical protein
MTDDRLARTFVELADTLVDDFDLVEFLQMLVDRCVELLEVTATGLLLGDSHERLRVVAASAENIHLLELFQLQNHEGPCLDAYRTGAPVNHPDLRVATDRWPLFAPAATEAGFRTVHAVPMRLRSQIIGALNLFHTDPHALSPQLTQIGQALADVATIGLIQERSLHHQHTLVEQLQHALDSRVIIEQAKGVLAERHGIDPGEAFTLLRDYARKHGQRLTELAAAIIKGSTTATELLGEGHIVAAVAKVAGAGGTALVGAMATPGWQTTRSGVSGLFGCDGPAHQTAIEAQLDAHAALVALAADPDEVRQGLAVVWRVALGTLLRQHPEAEEKLRALLVQIYEALPARQQVWVQTTIARDKTT